MIKYFTLLMAFCMSIHSLLHAQTLNITVIPDQPSSIVSDWWQQPQCLQVVIESDIPNPEPVRILLEISIDGITYVATAPSAMSMVTIIPGITTFSAADIAQPTSLDFINLAPGMPLPEGDIEVCVNLIPMSTSIQAPEPACGFFNNRHEDNPSSQTDPIQLFAPENGAEFLTGNIAGLQFRWEFGGSHLTDPEKQYFLVIYPVEWWQSPLEAVLYNKAASVYEDNITGFTESVIQPSTNLEPGWYAWTILESSLVQLSLYADFAYPFKFKVIDSHSVSASANNCTPCYFNDAIFLFDKSYCTQLGGHFTPQALIEPYSIKHNDFTYHGIKEYPFGTAPVLVETKDDGQLPKSIILSKTGDASYIQNEKEATTTYPTLEPGYYTHQQQIPEGEGQVLVEVSHLLITQENFSVSEITTDEKEMLENSDLKTIQDSLKAVHERLRRNEAAERRTKTDISGSSGRAQNADNQIREIEKKIKQLDSLIAINKIRLTTLYSIDQRLEKMESLHRKEMEDLAKKVEKLKKGKKGKDDLQQAVDKAKKELDDCLKAQQDLNDQLNNLNQQKQDIMAKQDALLAQLAAMYEADGWIGGTGRRADGVAKFGWAGCSNCPGEQAPRIAWGNPEYTAANNLANQIRQMNRQIKNLNAQISQIQSQLSNTDCTRFEKNLQDAEAALAQNNQLQLAESELNQECELIKIQLDELSSFCETNPNHCSGELLRLLQSCIENCPPSSTNHNLYWQNFKRLISEKKKMEERVEIKNEQDSIKMAIEQKRQAEKEATRDLAINESEQSQQQANGLSAQNEHDRAWRDALIESQKEKREEEEYKRWAAKFLNNDPILPQPQNIQGGNTNLWIGLYEAMAGDIRDLILNSRGCKQECLKGLSTMLIDRSVGGAFADMIVSAASLINPMEILKNKLIDLITKGAGLKIRVAAAAIQAMFNAYLNSGQEIKMIQQDYETEVNGSMVKLTALGYYYPATGSVHWYITCDKCQPPIVIFVKYRVNEHGRAISNPMIYFVD